VHQKQIPQQVVPGFLTRILGGSQNVAKQLQRVIKTRMRRLDLATRILHRGTLFNPFDRFAGFIASSNSDNFRNVFGLTPEKFMFSRFNIVCPLTPTRFPKSLLLIIIRFRKALTRLDIRPTSEVVKTIAFPIVPSFSSTFFILQFFFQVFRKVFFEISEAKRRRRRRVSRLDGQHPEPSGYQPEH
jgi:hypothetical protein